MRTCVIVFVLWLASAGSLAAQVPFDRNRDQAVGVMLAAASGSGVSYQEILPTAFGYRGTLALWNLGDFSFVDLGVSGLRILSDDGDRRVYVVGGVSYWRRSDEETREVFDDEGNLTGEVEVDDVDDSMAFGIGAGIQVPFEERLALSLEGVFTYWADSGDLLPLPQIGLHYSF